MFINSSYVRWFRVYFDYLLACCLFPRYNTKCWCTWIEIRNNKISPSNVHSPVHNLRLQLPAYSPWPTPPAQHSPWHTHADTYFPLVFAAGLWPTSAGSWSAGWWLAVCSQWLWSRDAWRWSWCWQSCPSHSLCWRTCPVLVQVPEMWIIEFYLNEGIAKHYFTI